MRKKSIRCRIKKLYWKHLSSVLPLRLQKIKYMSQYSSQYSEHIITMRRLALATRCSLLYRIQQMSWHIFACKHTQIQVFIFPVMYIYCTRYTVLLYFRIFAWKLLAIEANSRWNTLYIHDLTRPVYFSEIRHCLPNISFVICKKICFDILQFLFYGINYVVQHCIFWSILNHLQWKNF